MKKINKLGIDVITADATKLIRKLNRLESTSAQDRGVYREDSTYAKVYVETGFTFKELEDWLYYESQLGYVGVFEYD